MSVLISFYAWCVGGLYFVFLCFFVILLSLFLKPEKFDPWLKKSLKIFFRILFIKVRSEGAEFVDPKKPYLFISNHASLFDIPLLEAYVPTFFRGVEAQRQFRWPVYGWAIRRIGNIPIDRRNIPASIRSMKKAESRLLQGKSILVLPEGHRTLDGEMGEFKKLPFHLAKKAGVPIIPIGLSGLFQLKRKGSWIIRPGWIGIRFGKPLEPKIFDNLSVDELRTLVRKEVAALLT